MLEVRNLDKTLSGRAVLDGVSIRAEPAGITCVIGPNASGKTTLLRCLQGDYQVPPETVFLDGRARESLAGQWSSRFGVMPEESTLPDNLTGGEVLHFVQRARGLEVNCLEGSLVGRLIDALMIRPDLDYTIRSYSAGTRHKLAIALSLLSRPPVWLLDEPFNYLDPAATYNLKQFVSEYVKAEDAIALVVTHTLSLLQNWADQVYLLQQGRITGSWDAESMAAIQQSPDGLEKELARLMTANQRG